MPVDRPAVGPLAVHFCARQAGVTIQDYSLDDELLADCVVRYYEKFRPDAVWLSSDTWITGEAMGCHVVCTEPDQPMGGRGEPMVRTPSDIDRIPDPSVTSQARMPLMIRAMERIKERLGDDVFLVACFDQQPFSLACECMGINEIMLKVIDDPPFVEAMLERCIDYAVAYAIGLEQAGADMLSSGDSPAGLLGPSRYREFALPAERKVFQRLKEHTDKPLSIHICGDSSAVLADMAASGADVLEFDYPVDIAEACRQVGPDIALWGNVDPVAVLSQGTPDQVAEMSRDALKAFRQAGHSRFVLSSGCTLPVETPDENLRAMLDVVHEFALSVE
jgi:MtaA/CmuA family methyltransferase